MWWKSRVYEITFPILPVIGLSVLYTYRSFNLVEKRTKKISCWKLGKEEKFKSAVGHTFLIAMVSKGIGKAVFPFAWSVLTRTGMSREGCVHQTQRQDRARLTGMAQPTCCAGGDMAVMTHLTKHKARAGVPTVPRQEDPYQLPPAQHGWGPSTLQEMAKTGVGNLTFLVRKAR